MVAKKHGIIVETATEARQAEPGCDQHCVASQAVRRSEKVALIPAERPANGGLLRISH